jgi:hypothetical protein
VITQSLAKVLRLAGHENFQARRGFALIAAACCPRFSPAFVAMYFLAPLCKCAVDTQPIVRAAVEDVVPVLPDPVREELRRVAPALVARAMARPQRADSPSVQTFAGGVTDVTSLNTQPPTSPLPVSPSSTSLGKAENSTGNYTASKPPAALTVALDDFLCNHTTAEKVIQLSRRVLPFS